MKLNYRSQKNEVKRKKSLKRLHNTSNKLELKEASGSSQIPEGAIKKEQEETEECEESKTDENKEKDESEIWNGKQTDGVEKTREEEFEEYLTDLFL